MERGAVEFESPHPLPRALRTLAHEAVITEDGPHQLGKLVEMITANVLWTLLDRSWECAPLAQASIGGQLAARGVNENPREPFPPSPACSAHLRGSSHAGGARRAGGRRAR